MAKTLHTKTRVDTVRWPGSVSVKTENGVAYEENGVAYEEKGVAYEENGVAYEENGVAYEEKGVAYEEKHLRTALPMDQYI